MRLIDADALEEEFKKDIMGGLNYRWYINNAPTVCDIEQIRAEMQENINYNKKMNYQGIVAGLLLTLDIIDKYTKGERE